MTVTEKFLLEKLGEVSAEERGLLAGAPLNPLLYGMGDWDVTSSRLIKNGGISVRTHTRYADFPAHRHNFLEIMIVLSGSITHMIDGEAITLGVGDMLFMNKHITHSVRRADTEDIGINLCLGDNFVGGLIPELGDSVFSSLLEENLRPGGRPMYLRFASDGTKQIENLVENILFELTEYPRISDVVLTKTLALLFDYLSLKNSALLRGGSGEPDKDRERRRTVSDYIKKNYRTATLAELSGMMYMTPPYLSSLITSLFGMGFKELLYEERQSRAMRLLTETKLPIGEIIRSVGYENESYFHREFKARTGMTPLAYRKSAK